MENCFEINIGCIYPEILNISGDYGNITTIKKRLEWRNIKCNIVNIYKYDNNMPENCDIYFLGDGEKAQLKEAAEGLLKYQNVLKTLVDMGVVFLGIAGGYQLLGNYYKTQTDTIKGLEILDLYTADSENRQTGNVTVKTNFLTPETIVGFESHTGQTYLNNDTKPLGMVITGSGNNVKSKTEGARYKNVFGTYLHGPLLPKNPAFCDYLLELAIRKKINNESFKLTNLDDKLEVLTHNNLVNR